MQQFHEGLLQNLTKLHSLESSSDQRKDASSWLQTWQKDPASAKSAFNILNDAPDQPSTPGPPSAAAGLGGVGGAAPSHISSGSASPASSISRADDRIHLLMFCAQTLALKLKQTLMKPAELRAKSIEEWMAPQTITELTAKLRSYNSLKGILATCLGHSIVIRLCMSQDGISEVLEGMVKGLQNNHSLVLNAIHQGAIENAIRLLSAPHDNFAMIQAISDSLKIVSADPEGNLRQLALKLASMLWSDDLVELLEISAGQACSNPALFQLATNNVTDIIQLIEDYQKAWSTFVLNQFNGPKDYQMIVDCYPRFAALQTRITKFALVAPTYLIMQGNQTTQVTGFRELSVLQASLPSITSSINSAVKQLMNYLKTRGPNLKPPFSDLTTAPRYVVCASIFILNTNLELCLPLRELAEYRFSTLQVARSINGFNVDGDFNEAWQKVLANDEKISQGHREILDLTLNSFLANTSAEWWRLARSDPKSTTPQELLYGNKDFMHTSDLSSDEDAMSDLDGYGNMSINSWQKIEWNYSYSLATFVAWLSNLVHCFGSLFAFGSVCESFGNDAADAEAFAKLFSKISNIGIDNISTPLKLKLIKDLCDTVIFFGLPDYTILVEESIRIEPNVISSSFLMKPESSGGLKKFEIDRCITLNESSKMNYEFKFSTLNDAINNALRDYGIVFAHTLKNEGYAASSTSSSLLKKIIYRSTATGCYPINYDMLDQRLKKWFIEHRDEVRRNLKCWISVILSTEGLERLVESTVTEIGAQSAKSWRAFEMIISLLATLSSSNPPEFINYLGDASLINKSREHRAVLRQYLMFMAACSRNLAESGSTDFLRSSLIMCRASLRIPQADRSYPLSAMQDHIGAISLAKIISNLTKGIPDADLQSILTLHEDAVFLMRDAAERACGVALQEPARGQRCWVSMHSFATLIFCCGRYLAFGQPPQNYNEIVVTMIKSLIDWITKTVELLKGAPPPIAIAEMPTGHRLLTFLIRDLVLSLATYLSEILPPGLGCITNVLRSTGFQNWEEHAFGKSSPAPTAGAIMKARCEELCVRFPDLLAAASPLMTDRPTISEAFALLAEAILGSGLITEKFIEPVVQSISVSPLLGSLEHYLRALRCAQPDLIIPSIAELDNLIAARLNDCLSLNRCTLARSNELAIMSLALVKFFRLRLSLFQDVPFALAQTDLLMEAALGVSLISVLAYTHYMFCNPQSELLSSPIEGLELVADLFDKGFGNRNLNSLGDRFVQGVHNLVSDTQLKAATKGSAKSRESLTPSAPSPAPLLQFMTPNAPTNDLDARTAATVAVMTLISAQDNCSAATIVELHKSVDLAPRILNATSVDAAARYLARALPFDTNLGGVAISAAPYKWAASEESINQFVEAVRNATSIRKTLRNYCALLNVAKRRGSRLSSNLLSPQM